MPNQLSRWLSSGSCLRVGPSRSGSSPDRGRARAPALGGCGLGERCLALPAPARAQHAREAALARRRLRGTLRTAPARAGRTARRGGAAGRVGRLRLLLRRSPTQHEADGLAADRDRRLLLVCLGRARSCKSGQPSAAQTSKLARGVAAELQARLAARAGADDNGSEFRGSFEQTLSSSAPHDTHPRGAADNGAVESLTRRSSTSAGARIRRYLQVRFQGCAETSPTTCATTTSNAPTPAASPAAASPQTSSTVPVRWKRDEPHLSAHLGGCPLADDSRRFAPEPSNAATATPVSARASSSWKHSRAGVRACGRVRSGH